MATDESSPRNVPFEPLVSPSSAKNTPQVSKSAIGVAAGAEGELDMAGWAIEGADATPGTVRTHLPSGNTRPYQMTPVVPTHE